MITLKKSVLLTSIVFALHGCGGGGSASGSANNDNGSDIGSNDPGSIDDGSNPVVETVYYQTNVNLGNNAAGYPVYGKLSILNESVRSEVRHYSREDGDGESYYAPSMTKEQLSTYFVNDGSSVVYDEENKTATVGLSDDQHQHLIVDSERSAPVCFEKNLYLDTDNSSAYYAGCTSAGRVIKAVHVDTNTEDNFDSVNFGGLYYYWFGMNGGGEIRAEGEYLSNSIGGEVYAVNEGVASDYFLAFAPDAKVMESAFTGRGVQVGVLEKSFDPQHPLFEYIDAPVRNFSGGEEIVNIPETRQDWINHGVGVTSVIKAPREFVSVDNAYTDEALTDQITAEEFSLGYGVAPDAIIHPFIWDEGSAFIPHQVAKKLTEDIETTEKYQDLAVFNFSLGLVSVGDIDDEIQYVDDFQKTWRGGKGMSFVTGAGNAFFSAKNSSVPSMCSDLDEKWGLSERVYACEGATASLFNASPFTLNIGALDYKQGKAYYSSTGNNLWVSALGEAFVSKNSTDLTDIKEGTSFATPFVSGVVAQMIEANPALTWRDVRHIIAKTANMVDESISEVEVETGFGKQVIRDAWKTNAAGYEFHNWYGFGSVNAQAATQMAVNYSEDLGGFVKTPPKSVSTPSPDYVLPVGTTPYTATFSFDQADGVDIVENVNIKYTGEMSSLDSLGVFATLTSPSGTTHIVTGVRGLARVYEVFNVVANGFYGEDAAGDWELNIYDLTENIDDDEGFNLESVEVTLYGRKDS